MFQYNTLFTGCVCSMSYTRICWPEHASTNAAGAVVYLLSGAARSFNFIDEKGVAISLECENGDLVSMDGDLSSSSPCDVSGVPVGPNQLRGIAAVSYIVRFEWSAPHTCNSGTDLTSLIPYPKHVPDFVEYGVLGVDVEARQSSILESGLGLFLMRDYPDGGIVTEYDGPLRYQSKITGKRDKSTLSESSHWRSVPNTDFVIEGISEKRGLLMGRGGASLANHKPGNQANCKFEIIWTKSVLRPRFCEDDGCYHTVPRVVLTLLRAGTTGDELFVDYGEETAKRFLLNRPSSPPRKITQFIERHFYGDPRDQVVPASDLHGVSVQPLNVVTLGSDSMIVEQIDAVLSATVRQPHFSTFILLYDLTLLSQPMCDVDADDLVATTYVLPSFPLLSIGSEMAFLQVDDDISAKWVVIDDLCTQHLSCLWRRLVILKTARDLWAYSAETPSNNSAEALSRSNENSMRKKLFDTIDDSIVNVPVRVLDVIVKQFLSLTEHWYYELRASPDVMLAVHARAFKLNQICKLSLF